MQSVMMVSGDDGGDNGKTAGDAARLWLVVMMVVITVSGDDGQW